jgi:hypothetical protein
VKRLAILLPFLTGCASWQPSLTDAGTAARDIACTVCQAAGGPTEQAAKHGEALRAIAEALGRLAGDRDEVRAILRRLGERQDAQRQDYEELLDMATTPH